MVEWHEPGGQGTVSRAPLVFISAELNRNDVQSRYGVESLGDDIVTNPCLSELCERLFKVALP